MPTSSSSATHGTVKKTNKTAKADLEKASRMKAEYFEAKRKNTLSHV